MPANRRPATRIWRNVCGHKIVVEHTGKFDFPMCSATICGTPYGLRAKGTMANTILQSYVEGEIPRGKSAQQCLNDTNQWTGLSLE